MGNTATETFLKKGLITTNENDRILFPFTCGYIVFMTALQL